MSMQFKMSKTVLKAGVFLPQLLFLCFFNVLSAQTGSSQRLDEAEKLLKAGNYTAVKADMQQLTASDPQNGRAYFYLGMATIGIAEGKDYVEKASESFLKSAEAGYHLPFGSWEGFQVKENRYVEANWNVVKKILNEKDPQKRETAANLLENIVSANYREHKASERLGVLYVDMGQASKALDLFQRLLEANPDKSESLYNIGLGFLDIYNPERAQIILADLSSQGPEEMTSLMKLLMARAFFVQEENRIASVYYFQALDDLNEIVASEIYRDIIDIINHKEKDEYQDTRTIDQKKVFFRKFWKSRDPSPTTEYNERLVEHYRRLNYAKTFFGLKQTKGYDDRGRIYIKHGEPDQIAKIEGNFGLRDNATWLYRRSPDDFIFHFVKKTTAYFITYRLADAVIGSEYGRSFNVEADPDNEESSTIQETAELSEFYKELLMNRAEINPLYFQMANEQPSFTDPEYLIQEMNTNYAMEEQEILEPAITIGQTTDTYEPDMGSDPLNYYYYTSDFMAMNANSNVNIYYGLPVSELEFKRDIVGVAVNYESTFAVFDQEWNEVKRVYNKRNYQLQEEPNKDDKGLMLVDRQVMNLPPGDYHYSVNVRDLGNDHLGIYKGDFEVTHYNPGEFNVSKIILASSINEMADGQRPGKFTRGNLSVMPLPSRTFRQDQPVFVYYEIYFLTPDSDGKLRYNVDFTIEAEKLDRNIASKIFASFGKLVGQSKDKGKITLTFDKEGNPDMAAQVEWISIDISDSPAGEYNLDIEVTDAVSGKKITRQNTFFITKSK